MKKSAAWARSMLPGKPRSVPATRSSESRPVFARSVPEKDTRLAEIVVRGKEAHSAFPERGRSAIYDAARVVFRLEQVAKKLASRKNSAFDPPYTTLNVGLIHGGTAKNIVAGECRITVEWRPVPGDDPKRAGGANSRRAGATKPALSWIRCRTQRSANGPGVRSIDHRQACRSWFSRSPAVSQPQ